MKTSIKIFTTALVLCFMFSVQSFTMANSFAERSFVAKAQATVNEAAPDDWYTLAKMAEKCLKKNVNLKEAVEWLDQSLSIKRSVYNLKIKGNYYAKHQLYAKAIALYSESVILGTLYDPSYQDKKTQLKTRKLVIKLGRAYNGAL